MSRKPTLAFVTLTIAAATLLGRAQTSRVSGRVVADETNEPIPNARVAVTSGALGTPVVLTDGEGRFALTVANDGSAVVASKTGYSRSGQTPAAGQPIEIRLRRAAAISGRVVDDLGDPVPNARIFAEAVPRPASNPQADAAITTDDRGEYRLSGLPAGTFAVAIVRITLAASAGQDRRGPQKVTPSPSAVELVPVPVDPEVAPSSPATADIHGDWTFDLAGITGPRRLELTRAAAGWMLKEIRVAGIDVTDRPLPFGRVNQSLANVEVVFVDRISELRGTIVDDRGRPSAGSTVIVFTTDRDRWYSASRFFRRAATGTEGTFAIVGLPAGSYYAAAVLKPPADGDDAWQDTEYLRSLIPGAASVMLRDGQPATLNLQLPSR